ncbi:MAG: type II CRISPR RNA-guided endonuclease Cas9, partial [Bacteroidales bacterium]
MTKILGLDLGTNSIGWAVVDKENNKIDDCGVRIFPEGVVNMNEGEEREKSKNALRRENRQTRRQVARRRMRKIKLLELLIEQEMCPLTFDQLMVWKHWDKHKKSEGRHFPQTEEFIQWLKLNPYELRYKGINGDLTKMEFGRFLYHIVQRRGFLSSRKEKETGKIYAGKENMVGIDDTKEALNGNTLGEYLYSIYPEENESFKNIRNEEGDDLRIRGRYTLRDMYVEEFEKIWQKQASKLGLDKVFVTKQKVVFLNGSKNRNRNAKKIKYLQKNRDKVDVEEIVVEREKANKTLTRVTSYKKISLHDHLGGKIEIKDDNIKFDNKDSVLFYQRPLRSQKSLLGKCRYEKNKTPVSISHPDYEIFRAWQYVNTIKFRNNIPLPLEQKRVIVDYLISKKTAVKFADIVKLIQLSHENFNYNEDDKVEGCPTIAQLSKLFSKKGWDKYYHNIWHDFYFFDDSEKLFKKLSKTKKYELKENIKLEDVKKVSIKDDKYSSLSLKAIR